MQYLGDKPFSGSIHHGREYFGFHSSYITNHTINCRGRGSSKTSTSIRIFGDIGGTANYIEEDQDDLFFLSEEGDRFVQESSYNSARNNASGQKNVFPEIRLTNQGSISIECTGISTDRVTSFNHSIEIPIDPIYVVGSAYAAQVDVMWPIQTTTNLTLEIETV